MPPRPISALHPFPDAFPDEIFHPFRRQQINTERDSRRSRVDHHKHPSFDVAGRQQVKAFKALCFFPFFAFSNFRNSQEKPIHFLGEIIHKEIKVSLISSKQI